MDNPFKKNPKKIFKKKCPIPKEIFTFILFEIVYIWPWKSLYHIKREIDKYLRISISNSWFFLLIKTWLFMYIGRRICMGESLAKAELNIFFVTLIQNLKVMHIILRFGLVNPIDTFLRLKIYWWWGLGKFEGVKCILNLTLFYL